MENHSLNDFLAPNNQQKTIEGYPAPLRATIIAKK
jgi:tRNA (mo5U34)-methyltransferase